MPGKSSNSLLDAARQYRRQYHWCIIPADAETKKAAVPWKKYQAERPSEDQTIEWFGGGQYDALAVVGGAVSDHLVVLDFDSPETWEWWNKNHTDKGLPTEASTRGGHVFMRWPNCVSQTPKDQDVELRSRALITLVSPSPGKHWLVTPNGQIPLFNPFTLGLEAFGICEKFSANLEKIETQSVGRFAAPGATLPPSFAPIDSSQLPEEQEETEDPEDTEEPEDIEESKIASVSSCSSVNLESIDAEKVQTKIDEAIIATLPIDTGQRDRCVFTFCRWLKAIPELRDRSAAELRPTIQKWHTRAYPAIGTKPFEATWKDFVYGWKRVKWPRGMLLDAAFQKALEDTKTPPEAATYEDPRNQLLVRICWQLQQVHGNQPFYLALRTAGSLLDLSHTEASKRLEMLMADGILVIATPHTNIFATRYRYIRKPQPKELS